MTGTIGSRTAQAMRRIVLVGAIASLAACTPQYRNHGYIPTEDDLAAVQVGLDTRETVLELIGTPTAGGVLSGSDYYYVSSRFRHFGWLEPQEITREVLAVSFDAAGIVQNIERFGLEDGQVVSLSRRVTDDNIRDTTFIRQLMGNIGNFDAGSLIGEGGGP
jgi:outer membrane protein assembly factor BamE (lipoprotein component of BamABCDE complex)